MAPSNLELEGLVTCQRCLGDPLLLEDDFHGTPLSKRIFSAAYIDPVGVYYSVWRGWWSLPG